MSNHHSRSEESQVRTQALVTAEKHGDMVQFSNDV